MWALHRRLNAAMAEFYGDPDFDTKLGNCLAPLSCEPARMSARSSRTFGRRVGVRWDRTVSGTSARSATAALALDELASYQFPDPDDPTRYASLPASSIERHEGIASSSPTSASASSNGPGRSRHGKPDHGDGDRPSCTSCSTGSSRSTSHHRTGLRTRYRRHVFRRRLGQPARPDHGPRRWREFIEPRVRQMYEAVKAAGDTSSSIPAARWTTSSPTSSRPASTCSTPSSPKSSTCSRPSASTASGSPSSAASAPSASCLSAVSDVRDEVRRLLDQMGANGGYIASPAHAIPADGAIAENIAAMIEVLREPK